jgi:hypothetical protein
MGKPSLQMGFIVSNRLFTLQARRDAGSNHSLWQAWETCRGLLRDESPTSQYQARRDNSRTSCIGPTGKCPLAAAPPTDSFAATSSRSRRKASRPRTNSRKSKTAWQSVLRTRASPPKQALQSQSPISSLEEAPVFDRTSRHNKEPWMRTSRRMKTNDDDLGEVQRRVLKRREEPRCRKRSVSWEDSFRLMNSPPRYKGAQQTPIRGHPFLASGDSR